MTELQLYQLILIAIAFVWSGFVRSGLGFGGAMLALPFLLLIDDRPLVYLPLIAVQLLFFSAITVLINYRKSKLTDTADGIPASTVDWSYLKYALSIMIVPKLIGVFGLITLPAKLMSGIIFSIIFVYSISYFLNKPFSSKSKILDIAFLMLGGYISGTSLIGAPLIVAVFIAHVSQQQLRDTLFVLWFILVTIKIVAFIYAGVDLQLIHHFWLLPCAGIGHLLGLRLHRYMLHAETSLFFRIVGTALLLTSAIGLWKAIV